MSAVAPSVRWIWNRPLDLVVGCGAWTLPFLALTYPLMVNEGTRFGLEYAFYVGALFCNFPHYFATIHRVYGTQEDFRKYRFFTVYIGLLAIATVLIAHLGQVWFPDGRGLMPILMTIYLTWSPYHYAGQNYGLAMMMARRNGASPPDRLRLVLRWAFISSYVVWFLSHHTHPSTSDMFISLGLPPILAASAMLVGIPFSLIMGPWALWRLTKATSFRLMLPTIILFSTHTMWLTIPTLLELVARVPQLPILYSSGALAFMHCAQYLWITSYFAKKDKEAREGPGSFHMWRYYGTLVVGGMALFLPGPWIASRGFGLDLLESFLIFSAMVNLHHFIVDGAIWKLRDGRIAAMLLNTGREARDAVAATGPSLTGMLGRTLEWCRGPGLAPRALRYGLAVVLVVLAAVDITHYYAVNAPRPRIDIAERLNPSDTRVHLVRARFATANGDARLALEMVKEALRVDPGNVTALRLLVHLSTQTGNPREALALFPKLDAMVRPDVLTLTSVGHASALVGDLDAAVARLRAALDIDPRSLDALRLLGDVHLDRGEHARAAEYYERFLQVAMPAALTDPRRLEEIAEASLRLGDAYRALGRLEEATGAYVAAAQIAEGAPVADPLARALARLARVQAAQGLEQEARASHETALRAVAANGTDAAAVQAALEFATFLMDQGERERAVRTLNFARNRVGGLPPTHPARIRLEAMSRELERTVGQRPAPRRTSGG